MEKFEEFKSDVREYILANEAAFKGLTDAYEKLFEQCTQMQESIVLLNRKINLVAEEIGLHVSQPEIIQ